MSIRLRLALIVGVVVLGLALMAGFTLLRGVIAPLDTGPRAASDRHQALAHSHLERIFGGRLADAPMAEMQELKSAYTSDLFLLAPVSVATFGDGFEWQNGDAASKSKLAWISASFPDFAENPEAAHAYASDFLSESSVEAMIFTFENPARAYLLMTDF